MFFCLILTFCKLLPPSRFLTVNVSFLEEVWFSGKWKQKHWWILLMTEIAAIAKTLGFVCAAPYDIYTAGSIALEEFSATSEATVFIALAVTTANLSGKPSGFSTSEFLSGTVIVVFQGLHRPSLEIFSSAHQVFKQQINLWYFLLVSNACPNAE